MLDKIVRITSSVDRHSDVIWRTITVGLRNEINADAAFNQEETDKRMKPGGNSLSMSCSAGDVGRKGNEARRRFVTDVEATGREWTCQSLTHRYFCAVAKLAQRICESLVG